MAAATHGDFLRRELETSSRRRLSKQGPRAAVGHGIPIPSGDDEPCYDGILCPGGSNTVPYSLRHPSRTTVDAMDYGRSLVLAVGISVGASRSDHCRNSAPKSR